MATEVDLIKWRKAIRHPSGPASATMRHVLLTLSTWANTDGDNMFPSLETLAVATRLHRHTIGRVLQEAVASGWVLRQPRRGDSLKDARMFGYLYVASVPDGWEYLERLEHRWEQDPSWVSERRYRPRRKRGRVPAEDGDVHASKSGQAVRPVPAVRDNVPAEDVDRPRTGLQPSPSTIASVPAQGGMKSSSTSSSTRSLTTSHEGALSRTARSGPMIETDEIQRKRRQAAELYEQHTRSKAR